MLGIDRPSGDRPADQRDVPKAVPARAPDKPEPANPAADQAATDRAPRWDTLLTDARIRQEYALAYRAKVDTIYVAEHEANRGTSDQVSNYPSMVDKYQPDYISSIHETPQIDGPREAPEKWIDAVNHNKGGPGRDNNCGECARAVFNTWYGRSSVAAAMADARSPGEPTPRMSEWVSVEAIPVTMTEIGRRLAELGPGSSAIIGCDFRDGRGHWFNAVNDAGTVTAVDGQWGKVQAWPPTKDGFTFDPSRTVFSEAFFFDKDGRITRDDHT